MKILMVLTLVSPKGGQSPIVGGHAPMWDLVDNPDSIPLLESVYTAKSLINLLAARKAA